MDTATRQSHEARHSQLLRVAAAHFREKGYAGTTTRELADELGIQKATLYYHIRRKSDLLYEICVTGLTEMLARVSAATGNAATSEDRLRALVQTHLETALEDRDIYWTMLIEFHALRPEEKPEVKAHRAAYRHFVEETIADAQRAGLLRSDVDAHYLALALLNLLSWTIFWYRPDSELGPAEIGDAYFTLFLDGAAA